MVAIERRSAPIRFIVPSATREGPKRISSIDADRAELDALAARQVGVVRLAAPVEAAARGVGGPGERRADHHRVGAAGDGLGDVAGAADRAVGDDVDVAAAGLVEVVAPGGGDVGDGADAIGTAMPSTVRVVCAAPPPKPTRTPAAPVRIRCSAAWWVAQPPTMTGTSSS